MNMVAIKSRFRKFYIHPSNPEAIGKSKLVPSNEFSINKNNTTNRDSNITNPDGNISILQKKKVQYYKAFAKTLLLSWV